jgi:N-acetyl-D-muramate 6-phosphate phosphatase
MRPALRAVLFDLDGTLIDSAPDLAGAGNDMRAARGLPLLPLESLRPMVGAGARGMVGRALAVRPGDAEFESLRDEFLRRYEARMTRETHIFDAMRPVLAALSERGMPWGIVTNKLTRYTEPIVKALGLQDAAATLVCGDTTPHAKPHPAPLLEAARRLGLQAEDCAYVGDDLRDVQAGRSAGMLTVAAAWGYLGEDESIHAWGADHVVETADELLKLFDLA